MKNKPLTNDYGFTLIETAIVLIIFSIVGSMTFGLVKTSQRKAEETSIEADRQMLKSKCLDYYVMTGEYPVITTLQEDGKTEDFTADLSRDVDEFKHNLYSSIYLKDLETDTSQLPDMINRFKWVDYTKLKKKKMIDYMPTDDRFLLDTESSAVLHITDEVGVLDALKSLLVDSSDTTSINDMTTKKFLIKTSTSPELSMTKVNDTWLIGNTLFVGGKSSTGTPFALARVTIKNGGVFVEDWTGKLNGAEEVLHFSRMTNGLKIEYKTTSSKISYATLPLK